MSSELKRNEGTDTNYERDESAQTPTWRHVGGETEVVCLCYGGVDLAAREANLGRHTDAIRWHVVVRGDEDFERIAQLHGADEDEAVAVAHEWMREHPGGR